MTARRWLPLFAFPFLIGCTIEAPFDPLSVVGPLANAIESIQKEIENAVADPLDSKPFPVLIGGDSERIFYATNLGDIRITFPGRSNDLVLPGLLGPSNLYVHQGGERSLLRPLVVGGTFTGAATDGEWVTYVQWIDQENPGPYRLLAGPTGLPGFDSSIYEIDPAAGWIYPAVDADAGRAAFVTRELDVELDVLRVVDLGSQAITAEISAAEIVSFDLKVNRLAWAERTADSVVVRLRDLTTAEDRTLATGIRSGAGEVDVFVTLNAVVWNEPTSAGVSRVVSFDLLEERQAVRADAIPGALAGATDTVLVTQEYTQDSLASPWRITIRRHTPEEPDKVLAEFRADGLAGQARILGDRIVFVNRERKIVVASLVGEGRTNFEPY